MAEVIHIRQQKTGICFEQVMGVWGKGTAFESACPASAHRKWRIRIPRGLAISFFAHGFAAEF